MTAAPDTPGVIAPPPLIYIGFLLFGWAIFRFAATPEVVGPEAAGWLGLGFGLSGMVTLPAALLSPAESRRIMVDMLARDLGMAI